MRESFLKRNQKLIFFLIGIPVLLTFSITTGVDQFFARFFGGGQSSNTFGTFVLPSGEKVYVDAQVFRDFSQNLMLCANFMPSFRGEEISEQSIWRFLMLYHTAVDAGIYLPVEVVRGQIRQIFQNREQYESYLANLGRQASQQMFEHYLSRAMVVENFVLRLLSAADVPQGGKILEQWQEQNEEFQLQYVEFPAAQIREELSADDVTDEQLQKYLDELGEPERNRLYGGPEKISIEGATLVLSKADVERYAELLADDEFSQADQRSYYQLNRIYRFRRQKEEPTQAGTDTEAAPAQPNDPFYSYEEVKDRVLREVQLKRVMEELLQKAQEESEKQGASWEQFAEQWGLEIFRIAEPKTRQDLRSIERFGSVQFANQAFASAEHELASEVAMAADDFFIYKIAQKIPAGVPPLAEIRDKALQDYLDQQAFRQAKENADKFYAALTTSAEDTTQNKKIVAQEDFRKVADDMDLAVQNVDYFSQTYRFKLDWTQTEEGPVKFLQGQTPLFELAASEVAQPIEDSKNNAVYVARVADRRKPDPQLMSPNEFEQTQQQMLWLERTQGTDEFSYDKLKTLLQLQLN